MANSCRSMGWILGIDAVVYVSELSLALIPIALLRGLCTRGEVHQRAVLNWMEIKEKVTAAKPDARWIDFFYNPTSIRYRPRARGICS